jgi:hypothetical protein
MAFFFSNGKRSALIPLVVLLSFGLSGSGFGATAAAWDRAAGAGYSPLTFHQLSHKSGYIFALRFESLFA